VLARVKERITHFKPGIPTDPATTMGAIVSKVQLDRVLSYIASAKAGRRAAHRRRRPAERSGAGERASTSSRPCSPTSP
jgi:betaine-aldehyde dehydrogenase